MVEALDKLVSDGSVWGHKVDNVKAFIMEPHGLKPARWVQMHNVLQATGRILHPLWHDQNSNPDEEAFDDCRKYMYRYARGDTALYMRL